MDNNTKFNSDELIKFAEDTKELIDYHYQNLFKQLKENNDIFLNKSEEEYEIIMSYINKLAQIVKAMDKKIDMLEKKIQEE
jgi:polyhydroxyalkanoate synthesis regulator phasin